MSDEPNINDITHQSHRIARLIDRLPDGEYKLELVKGDKESAWRMLVRNPEGEIVRDWWDIAR